MPNYVILDDYNDQFAKFGKLTFFLDSSEDHLLINPGKAKTTART